MNGGRVTGSGPPITMVGVSGMGGLQPAGLLLAANRMAQPWANGGGITREVAVRADAEGFQWRVSLAEVASSGPFSEFPGVERTIVLLSEGQLVLDFGTIVKIFNLKSSGKGIVAVPASGSKNDTLKLKQTGSTMSLTATFKNGGFVDTLKAINGFGQNDNTSPTRNPRMDFYVLYGGYLYTDLKVPVAYKVNAKAGTGSGKSQ